MKHVLIDCYQKAKKTYNLPINHPERTWHSSEKSLDVQQLTDDHLNAILNLSMKKIGWKNDKEILSLSFLENVLDDQRPYANVKQTSFLNQHLTLSSSERYWLHWYLVCLLEKERRLTVFAEEFLHHETEKNIQEKLKPFEKWIPKK